MDIDDYPGLEALFYLLLRVSEQCYFRFDNKVQKNGKWCKFTYAIKKQIKLL